MPYDPSGSRESFHVWLEDALAATSAKTEAAFATVDVATGKPVGSTRYLTLRPEHRGLEIGWTWLGKPWQRTAINTEAKYLMLKHAFENLGCVRVEFKADALNLTSRRALLGIGAVEEGVLRQHLVAWNGRLRDTVYYSVLDHEWPNVKRGLESKLVTANVLP
jgi:RimJ/RimL family protein N-acetyltransferase